MKKTHLILIVVLLVVCGVLGRMLPHEPNMTPIVALMFVSSLYLGRKYLVFLIPLSALAISDFFIGLYDWKIMFSVYGSFFLIGLLSLLTKKHKTFLGVALPLCASSVLFFLITNGAVWFFSPWYEKSFVGLLYAYELGIPFLRNMFVGDVLYTVSLVALFELVYATSLVVRVKNRIIEVGLGN